MDKQQRDELLNAIWGNFEHFLIVTYDIKDDGFANTTTFVTENGNKIRRFNMENFLNSYQEGRMDIEDLIYVLF